MAGDEPPTKRVRVSLRTQAMIRPLAPKAAAAGEEIPADLIVIAHPSLQFLGTRYRLEPGAALTIGRSSEADVSLPDVTSVSREHARLHFVGSEVWLEDLGSTNGTWVEDDPLTAPRVLSSGDRFQVGSVHFKLLQESEVETAYHAAVYELMTRDGLTDAFNKRSFEEAAVRECLRSERHARPLALVIFDVDHFKHVNDTHGHPCGDMVLRKTAGLSRGLIRPEQIFARIGGEEFAILCPETSARNAGKFAERLREALALHEHRHQRASFHVTCSFGVSELLPNWAWPELYAAADAALYLSKQGGRNRVTTAPETPSP
jgi:two-component system, cell cycle response regulator